MAAQVNADFDTIFSWINGGSAMWSDGSTAFTAVPSGPASDPVSANQFTRKQYVDNKVGLAAVTPLNPTLWNAKSGGPPSATGLLLQAGTNVVTTNASGGQTINYPTGFPNGLAIVQAVIGDDNAVSPGGLLVSVVNSGGTNKTGFSFIVRTPTTGAVAGNTVCRIDWLAIGW